MKMTAQDLLQLRVVDDIIPEPTGGAHSDWERTAELLRDGLARHLAELKALSVQDLLSARRAKFMAMGEWHDA
jgi:acetyl-CoA carboxylase carboxyl transferase subunit alpha